MEQINFSFKIDLNVNYKRYFLIFKIPFLLVNTLITSLIFQWSFFRKNYFFIIQNLTTFPPTQFVPTVFCMSLFTRNSLTINYNYLFMYLLTMCLSFSEKCVFTSFLCFIIEILNIVSWKYLNILFFVLHILDINPLSGLFNYI